MTSAFAMGGPWAGFGGACGPGAHRLRRAFAAMAGHETRGGPHPFAQWGMFGGQAPFPPPWAGGRGGWPGTRGPKARRGDVRAAILAVLVQQPMNGYQIIQEIAARSGGAWKPSPGSIYPTLQQLEDEGLVRAEADASRRLFALTDEGRAYVNAHPEEVESPWQAMADSRADSGPDDSLRPLLGQIAAAMWQVAAVGTPEQQRQARDALADLRRTLYRILAESEQEPGADG